MSTLERSLHGRLLPAAVAALALAASSLAAAQQGSKPPPQGPNLGVPATAAQIAGWDISIPPDGAGLPEGAGTPADGARVYATKCIGCHGKEGAGNPADRLVGGRGTIASDRPVRTVGSYWPYATTLFDYIRRAMPYPAPHSLTNDEAYALTAYLLRLNGIVGDDAKIDAETLPKIKMPNAGNFEWAWPNWHQ